MLTVIDELTRRCLAIVVEGKIEFRQCAPLPDRVLHPVRPTRPHPHQNNGDESTARAVRGWLGQIGVKTVYIEPGLPWEI